MVWVDAKPENILIDENDDLWFIDFGGSFMKTKLRLLKVIVRRWNG
jgi:thiamine kinase-like enzyme